MSTPREDGQILFHGDYCAPKEIIEVCLLQVHPRDVPALRSALAAREKEVALEAAEKAYKSAYLIPGELTSEDIQTDWAKRDAENFFEQYATQNNLK